MKHLEGVERTSWKELPFRQDGCIVRVGKGLEAEVFGFVPERGKEYVFKEVYKGGYAFETYGGKTLEEKASIMQKVYEVLKRHCGDYVVTTQHLIGRNRVGQPGIMRVQEKVRGDLLEVFLDKHHLLEEDSPLGRYDRQREILEEQVREAGCDPEFLELVRDGKVSPPKGQAAEDFFKEVFYVENIIVDSGGNIRVIDW